VVVVVGVSGHPISLPGSSDPSWKASEVGITKANKSHVLLANHCNAPVRKSSEWGVNVYYADGSVRWKPWEELRFQVMFDTIFDGSGSGQKHCYFF